MYSSLWCTTDKAEHCSSSVLVGSMIKSAKESGKIAPFVVGCYNAALYWHTTLEGRKLASFGLTNLAKVLLKGSHFKDQKVKEKNTGR